MQNSTKTTSSFSAIRVFLTNNHETIKANVSCLVGGLFWVSGMKVLQGKNGLFVSMPARKDAKGEYKDIAFPASKEVRDQLQQAVLEEFERMVHSASASLETAAAA